MGAGMYYQYNIFSASQNDCVHREVGCRHYRLLMWFLLCSRTLVYFVMLMCLASIDPWPSSDALRVSRISLCVYVCLHSLWWKKGLWQKKHEQEILTIKETHNQKKHSEVAWTWKDKNEEGQNSTATHVYEMYKTQFTSVLLLASFSSWGDFTDTI